MLFRSPRTALGTNRHQRQNENPMAPCLLRRAEAAKQIGIENIRNSRIARLEREKKTIEENYKKGQNVCPDFKLVLLVKLEA